ncbi:3'-5' exonuclease [Candidatus Woesearchaeota archaeon]|nr:3'-5' exonuclease [Candidatus Woesearchaeota archaeon]
MIVVDVETTGINPQSHSIVSIGAVDFFHPANTFYSECNIFDGAEVSEKALEINGFSLVAITDRNKLSLEQAIKKYLEWTSTVSQKTIAGENPTFDRDFLRASAERYGIAWPLGRRVVDLHSVSYAVHLGAMFEAEAFSRLFYGKVLLSQFDKFPIPDYLQKR